MDINIDFSLILKQISIELIEEMRAELVRQGHKASGKLMNSITSKVESFVGGASAEISYLFYGRFLETGLSASAWRKPPGRAEIAALISWIKRKRITPKTSYSSFAWGIATNRRKVGYPSPNSVKYSKNGKIINFQSIAIDNVEDSITKKIADFTEEQIEAFVINVITNTNKQVA